MIGAGLQALARREIEDLREGWYRELAIVVMRTEGQRSRARSVRISAAVKSSVNRRVPQGRLIRALDGLAVLETRAAASLPIGLDRSGDPRPGISAVKPRSARSQSSTGSPGRPPR